MRSAVSGLFAAVEAMSLLPHPRCQPMTEAMGNPRSQRSAVAGPEKGMSHVCMKGPC